MTVRTARRRPVRVGVAAASAALGVAGLVAAASPASAHPAPQHRHHSADSSCQLSNGIKHVIQIQFDNVHLTRDNPNVASDLQQMPHLLNFLKRNGVVLANTHDVLSHTATNVISNQTGLYPDRTGVTQANSFNYYDAAGNTHPGVSFAYWTDPIYDYTGANADTKYNSIYTADREDVPNNSNVNVPAPWVPYTRAGCNVADVSMGNTVLENTDYDIPQVFGPNSPEAQEAQNDPAKAQADFVGYAIHCAKTSDLCASGKPDQLPDEPGGYSGYQALYGNAEIQPVVSPSGPIRALDGSVIADANGNVGFPGFDSETPNNALGYAAQLLEHGSQIADIYLSDAHTDHTGGTGDFGPGEQGYEQQLHAYDLGFQRFFARLRQDGITPQNTLFAVTTDEGDHFSGSAPMPADCTGQPGNYCTYDTKSEVNVNLTGLLASERGNTTPWAIHSDPAPALWLTGNPDRTSAAARDLERDLATLRITNPLTGRTDKVAYQQADRVEQKILHFISSDAARSPTLTAFSGEDEYVTKGDPNCNQPCVYTSQGFAWNHGGIWPDMQDIWAGYAGPGVKHRGIDRSTWNDQTDMRPTILALTGLHDDYPVDGRVLVEDLRANALPHSLRKHGGVLRELGRLYKQILASDARFAEATLAASTRALAADEQRYTVIEDNLSALGSRRNAIAEQMSRMLLGAAFDHRAINLHQAHRSIHQARALLNAAERLAG